MSAVNIGMRTLFAGILMVALWQPALAGHGDLTKGEMVYEETCIACHGETGQGELPGVPDFTSTEENRLAKSEETLIEHVIDGFETPGAELAMPPKGGNPDLTEEDVHDVVFYLRKQFGNMPSQN